MALDERLKRGLERAALPSDPSGVYEQMIRRKERRRIARMLQNAALAVAVVGGSVAAGYGLSLILPRAPAPEPPVPRATSPSPSPARSPMAEGARDIGLGFPVCFPERLDGIDFLGDGTDGTAWTAVHLKDDGSCQRYSPNRYLLAADHTGDGAADSWIDLPFACENGCVPLAGTDLDRNGSDELVVAHYFSIVDHRVFAVRPSADDVLRLQPILVAEPGHPPAEIDAGEPLWIDAGGDEGYASSVRCEGYPSNPVIVWSWSYSPKIDGDEPTEVHVTRLQLRADGRFHVIETNDFTVAPGEPTGVENATELGPECGVDWYPS